MLRERQETVNSFLFSTQCSKNFLRILKNKSFDIFQTKQEETAA
jgi:hypothetical protein